MLEIALLLAPWPGLMLQSRNELYSVSERVYSIRKKHLCEGSFSPASSILT